MCLIALAWDCHPRWRLALIANRDEFHARPSAPLAAHGERTDVIGGRDLEAGGGWLQLSTHGRMAAVTNVREGLDPRPRPRSRGALVAEFVRADAPAKAFLDQHLPTAAQYGRFNLVLWDGDTLWHASNHPRVQARALPPGLHAVSNGPLDAPWPKARRTRQALADWLRKDVEADPEPLFAALADTTEAPDHELPTTGIPLEWERRLSAVCVRGGEYGTRSSSVLLIARDRSVHFEERRFAPFGVASGRSGWQGELLGPDAA